LSAFRAAYESPNQSLESRMISDRAVGWIPINARRAAVVLGVVGLAAVEAGAAQQPTPADSAPLRSIASSREVVAGTAIILGAFLIDRPTRVALQENRSSTRNDLARVGNAFGNPLYFGPFVVGAYLLGRVTGRPPITSAAIRLGATVALASAASFAVKAVVGRYRPDQGGDPAVFKPFSGKESFPSGHSTAAFALAASLASNTDRLWIKSLLFAGAGLTGFARMNDDKHWLSDVLAGAALGVLTSRLTTRIAHAHRRVAISPAGLGLQLSF
jgi:membrane-associated phospholipid phosphatase